LLVVGFEDGDPASVNVSTQGIGAGEQSIGVGAAVQINVISGGTQGTGSANEIAYGNHVETEQAGFQITQINPNQGGNNRVDVTIAADNVTGDEQGNEFYDGSPVTSIPVTRVQVLAADGVTVLEDSANPLIDDPDITVSFASGVLTVDNLLVDQNVRFFTRAPMDRFTVTNVDSAKNTSFDIGGFQITTEQEGSASEAVGSLIQSDDDGPTIVARQNAPTLIADENGISGLDGCEDETGSNTAKASFASIFEIDAGRDDAHTPPGLVYELGTVGGNSGLKDEVTNLPVILSMIDGNVVGRIDDGGVWRTVLTISVDPSGEVTFTQDRPVVQPDPNAVTDQQGFASIEGLVTLTASLADQDHDPASLTRDITASFVTLDHGCDDCANPTPPTWNPAAVMGTDSGELLKGTSIDGKGGNDTIQGGNKGDLFYGGDGNDNLQPGNGDDSVDGGAGNDTMSGGFGNDLLIGGSGNDSISGGPGNDTAWGGDGDDSISGSAAGDDCLHGNAGNDTINGGIDNDEVWGDEGNDFLVGNVGNDTLFGGIGNDFIRGDEGNDHLFGGEGADIFYFGKNSGTDVIHDFQTGVDDINVKGLGLTSWVKVQAVLTYDAAGAHIDVGTNHIRVNDVTSLSASDFIFV
jgi:Ca2+-binding RTX toxin-like protein